MDMSWNKKRYKSFEKVNGRNVVTILTKIVWFFRNLVKKSLGKKKDEDEEKTFSYVASFQGMLHELDDLAGQHEVIAERLKKDIVPNISAKSQHLRATRKHQLAELQSMNSQITSLNENMNKYQKNYA